MFDNSNLPTINPTYDKFYRDLSLTTPSFLTTEEEVIQQYIQTMLQTRQDSIPFEEFGIHLEEYLFEITSDIYTTIIFDTIVRGVQTYMPSVKIDFSKSGVVVDPYNDRQYILTLVVYTEGGKAITINENLGVNMTFKES